MKSVTYYIKRAKNVSEATVDYYAMADDLISDPKFSYVEKIVYIDDGDYLRISANTSAGYFKLELSKKDAKTIHGYTANPKEGQKDLLAKHASEIVGWTAPQLGD